MSEWTDEQVARFKERLQKADDEAANETLIDWGRAPALDVGRRHVVDWGRRPPAGTYPWQTNRRRIDPEPKLSTAVETPCGQARKIREEDDGEILVWVSSHQRNVKVSADLVRCVNNASRPDGNLTAERSAVSAASRPRLFGIFSRLHR